MPVFKLENVQKKFDDHIILNQFSADIEAGELVAFTGASGVGKTTILNMLSMLEKPTEGRIYYQDKLLPNFYSREGKKLLKNDFAYIFQNFALIHNKTV